MYENNDYFQKSSNRLKLTPIRNHPNKTQMTLYDIFSVEIHKPV